MNERARSGRFFGGLMIVLLLLSSVQVYGWMSDQRRIASALEATRTAAVAQDSATAARRLDALLAEQHARLDRYAWQGAFFLAVLTASIAVIWRGTREQIAERDRQEAFLALVSHQFKTPLASLRMAIETITLRRPGPEGTERLAHRALDDVRRLEDLIAHILESARLDAGRVVLRRERIALSRAVSQTLRRVSERAQQAGAALSVEVDPALCVLADPVALDAVLRNLVENAIAAVAPGGSGNIRIAARRDADSVVVDVRDDGVGFDPGASEKLFDKFGVERHGSPARDRTGLGLYIVSRLMRLGGGDVRAHSEGAGHGACFTMRWPACD
jgi:signal transduction histidine kinase